MPSWRRHKSSFSLLDWLEGWTDVQSVSDYCGVNPSYVLLLPREDILILSQEMGKEAYEVFRKLRADVGEVFRVVIQRYKFQLFRGLRLGVHLVAHLELVQVYFIDRFLLHECQITFFGHALVSLNHPYSACGRELDHHVVSRGNGLYGL